MDLTVFFFYFWYERCAAHGKKRTDPSFPVQQAEPDVISDQKERPQWMEASLGDLFSRLITKAARSYRQQKDPTRHTWPHRVTLARRFDIRL